MSAVKWAQVLPVPTVESRPESWARRTVSRLDRGRSVAKRDDGVDLASGVRVAVEFNSQAEQFNALAPMRELLALAGHPLCGLLLDAYHLERSGGKPDDVDDVAAEEITYVQFSDVPRTGLVAGAATDRLPPGAGSVPFPAFFQKVAAKGYTGYASYEAPNPQAWARPAADVAREALTATRAVLR